jgi:hypothetical protein
MFVSAPTPLRGARILLRKQQEKDMKAETMDTGWKRFLDRIRRLWETEPVDNPTPVLKPTVPSNIDPDSASRVSSR